MNKNFEQTDFGMFEQKEFSKSFETAATIRKIMGEKATLQGHDMQKFMKLN